MRLLILDDDPYTGAALTRALRSRGILPTLAYSSEEAYRCLEAGAFDVVLTDLRLFGPVDGHEFLRVVAGRFPNTRRILMSGSKLDLADGVAHVVLEKPFTTEMLVAGFEPLGTEHWAA